MNKHNDEPLQKKQEEWKSWTSRKMGFLIRYQMNVGTPSAFDKKDKPRMTGRLLFAIPSPIVLIVGQKPKRRIEKEKDMTDQKKEKRVVFTDTDDMQQEYGSAW